MDLPESVILSTKLNSLLSVKAHDKVISYLADSEGNWIDCNVYHPKYGYKGFVTRTTTPIVTQWKPIVYRVSNQLVYCKDYLEMTCIHEDGSLTNRDKVDVFLTEKRIPDFRLAESVEEFEEIYDREFKASNYENKGDIHDVFRRTLAEHVNNLNNSYCKSTETGPMETRNLDLIVTAESFIKFLNLSEPVHENKDLSLQEKALISAYENKIITNKDGAKLYQHFLNCYTRPKRIAIEETRKKTLNKIERIEKIISYLSNQAQNIAIDEVNTLKSALERETF